MPRFSFYLGRFGGGRTRFGRTHGSVPTGAGFEGWRKTDPFSQSKIENRKSKIACVLFAFLLLAIPVQAQVNDAVLAFDAGNEQFARGAYQEALRSYQQAIDAGYVSGALYYNMGNAYFRLDQLGQAIRYYEKARRLIPENAELQHNLKVARSQVATPISSLPTPVWETWWDRFVLRVGAFPFFVAGLLFYALAAALVGHRIWSGMRNPWLRRALSASVILGVVLLAIAFAASLNPTLDQRAVVVADTAALREAPADTAATELDVPEGVLVDVLQRQDTWLEVRLPNGVTGWIQADTAADV
jgi:hypothetical protein